MYCSRCGRSVRDNDSFCSGCGNRLAPPVEEIIFNPSLQDKSEDMNQGIDSYEEKFSVEPAEAYEEEEKSKNKSGLRIDTSEFVWNVHEFNHENRRPDKVVVDWEGGRVIEVGAEGAEKIEEIAEKEEVKPQDKIELPEEAGKQASDMGSERETEDEPEGTPERTEELKPITIEDIKEDIVRENRDMKRDTARIEKFYTLNRKNEEFQKLLDREYERIRGGKIADTAQIYLEFERLTNLDFEEPESVKASEIPDASETPEIPEAPEAPEISETPEAPEMTETIETSEKPELRELLQSKKDSIFSAETNREPEKFDPVTHLERAEKERKAVLGILDDAALDGIMENDAIIRKFDTMELEKDLIESTIDGKEPGFETVALDEIFGKILEEKKIEEDKEAAEPEQEEPERDPEGEWESSEKMEQQGEPETEPKDLYELSNQEKSDQTGTDEAEEGAETLPQYWGMPDEDEESEPEDRETVILNQLFGQERVQEIAPSEETHKKGGPGKVILIIVIIVLLLECVALGIRYLAPESAAASFINEKMSIIAGLFTGEEDPPPEPEGGTSDETGEENNQGEGGQESEPVNSLPAADKNLLIVEQADKNKNIETIVANNDLKYNESAEYSSEGIKNSRPIEDNIFSVNEDGTAVYTDAMLVGTLIAFDSGWIDYVNSGDRSVFDLLKKGSNAYNNCNAFKKKVTKTFVSLEIGEIRQGEKGYYVWAREKIQTVDNGKTTIDEYNWIYYMEPVAEEMKIVDYYRYKS